VDENINAAEESKETPLHSGKKADFEVNVAETVYMLMSRHQNAGQNLSICIGDIYLGWKLTNRVHLVINSRLNAGNARHRRFQNLLLSRLLSEQVNIKGLSTPVHFHVHETWSLRYGKNVSSRAER
jgi:hypothetical protein